MDPAKVVMLKALELQEPMNAAMKRGDSAIQEWYKGTVVSITGGSGFLGKLLIEKLLRSCDIKKIYILMKPKKGKGISERLNDMVKEELFDIVRERKPDFTKKIIPVEGDVTELQLGIGPSDWKTLADEVNVIFHEAATTRFNEQLTKATLVNVRGTREILQLGKACKKLRSFVHVSTGFCHATNERIGGKVLEQFYPCPVSPSAIIQLAESISVDKMDSITPALIEGWTNTYAFTKAIAEELIRVEGSELPINIVRPPLVLSSYYEPVPGWPDKNIFTLTGIVLGGILGVIHVVFLKRHNISIAPADLVTNATVAAAWDAAVRREEGGDGAVIYTVSNNKCNYSLGEILDYGKDPKGGRGYASPKAVWYCTSVDVDNRFAFWILYWLFHYIPAYIVTSIIYLLGVTLPEDVPPIMKMCKKYYELSVLYASFQKEWFLTDDNTVNLYERLSKTDRDIFNFDVRTVDWHRWSLIGGLGVRKYLIRDGLEGTDYAVKKQIVLKILNYVVYALFVYLLYMIVRFVFGLVLVVF